MLAEAGFPTVLVDVDLRKSVMKTRFQMDYDDDTTMGLNHYLSGMAEYEDVIYSTNIPNGYMVPCTQLLENPSACLLYTSFTSSVSGGIKPDFRYNSCSCKKTEFPHISSVIFPEACAFFLSFPVHAQ